MTDNPEPTEQAGPREVISLSELVTRVGDQAQEIRSLESQLRSARGELELALSGGRKMFKDLEDARAEAAAYKVDLVNAKAAIEIVLFQAHGIFHNGHMNKCVGCEMLRSKLEKGAGGT